MWDISKDYMTAFLGAIFLLVSLITIPDILKSKKRLVLTFICVGILCWLGLDKVNRDKEESDRQSRREEKSDSTITSLKEQVGMITGQFNDFRRDQSRLMIDLKKDFSIGFDSLTKKPYRISNVFNTRFTGPIENVTIGPKK